MASDKRSTRPDQAKMMLPIPIAHPPSDADIKKRDDDSLSTTSTISTTSSMQAHQLCAATLEQLHSTVQLSKPTYDRSKLSAGIVHVGVGNFHRSHMATYLDDLFAQCNDQGDESQFEWGIVGAGVMPQDETKRAVLQQQDWLTTLVERDATTEKARVIGSMVDFLPVSQSQDALATTLQDPAIKIVSLTVTEGGYYIRSDGTFDAQHKHIQRDVTKHPNEAPSTVFGLIIQALHKRRLDGHSPFTVMSCDNVPHNGDVTRSVVVGLARLMMPDSDHADWIQENVAFPNSMVDRITIATKESERQYMQDALNVRDNWPVFCEPFRQWILEDTFPPNGRPALEKVGVQFCPDVTPYEIMKLRVLNGGHAALCYPAALLGVPTVADAMQHTAVREFLDTLERNEIIPTVPPVPDTDVTAYWDLIADRFSNPMIGDSIGRICYDGASRQPKFIVAPIVDALSNEDDGRIDGLALVSAMWCRYCQGKTEDGQKIEPNDPMWDRLQKNATTAVLEDKPTAWLDMTDIYGSVGNNPRFVQSFAAALRTIRDEGVESAMRAYVNQNN